MCHAPAICFQVKERGFIREGYWADLTLINPDQTWTVAKENIYYQCGWSPLEGKQFMGRVVKTLVNGDVVYDYPEGFKKGFAKRLEFER
jgi:dihydroorotase